MTLPNHASRYSWARFVQQRSHVMSANGAAHSASVCSQDVETIAHNTLLPVSAVTFAQAMHARI